MVGNDRDYLYSVGGRVKFGETAEEAVVREVWRKQAFRWKLIVLALCTKSISMGDAPSKRNKLYEISLIFYMKVPDAFAPVSESLAGGSKRTRWVSLDEDIPMYPQFFKTELKIQRI